MSPDDDRHGSRRGYYAHRRAGQDSCDLHSKRASARRNYVKRAPAA